MFSQGYMEGKVGAGRKQRGGGGDVHMLSLDELELT